MKKVFFVLCIVIFLLGTGVYLLSESSIPDKVKVLRSAVVAEGFKLCGKDEKCFEDFLEKNLKKYCTDSKLEKEDCLLLKEIVEEKYSFKLTFS